MPGRDRFLELVRQAHVLISGLRAGALATLGYGLPWLRVVNPSLMTARLNAYGWSGPWPDRRGFESLVQMSCGIAFLDAESAPSPLPAQALDHASGYLLAAAVRRALARQVRTRIPTDVATSLVATANVLLHLPTAADRPPDPAQPARPDHPAGPDHQASPVHPPCPDHPADTARSEHPQWPAELLEDVSTAWGPARRVRLPGSIDGVVPSWSIDAGPLGRHEATFA